MFDPHTIIWLLPFTLYDSFKALYDAVCSSHQHHHFNWLLMLKLIWLDVLTLIALLLVGVFSRETLLFHGNVRKQIGYQILQQSLSTEQYLVLASKSFWLLDFFRKLASKFPFPFPFLLIILMWLKLYSILLIMSSLNLLRSTVIYSGKVTIQASVTSSYLITVSICKYIYKVYDSWQASFFFFFGNEALVSSIQIDFFLLWFSIWGGVNFECPVDHTIFPKLLSCGCIWGPMAEADMSLHFLYTNKWRKVCTIAGLFN